ncbi:MAG: FtsX-like permease family protein [Bacteroidales bacterium]|nr:FtsX-like permease family protein [Bacteroidales bacterium]
MKPWFIMQESFQSAIKTVSVNKLRTILSLLGITIGIFAIISVFTIIDSLEANLREDIAALGDDVIYIQKWPWAPENGEEYEWWKYFNRPLPSMREYQELKRRIEKAKAISFFAATGRSVKYKDNSVEGLQIWGISEEFDQIRDFSIASGRFLSGYDIETGNNIAVVGQTVVRDLLDNVSPIGKKITVEGRDLTIVGTFAKEGKSAVGGGSLDKTIMVPIGFYAKIVNLREEQSNPMIWVKAAEGIPVGELKEEVRIGMRIIRRLKPKAEDNFALNQTSMFKAGIAQIFGVINIAGWIIGGFSILVGGFGIANIMFVSVKERTNIIGIQKALGAKRRYILYEVLYESGILSLMGGIIGLLLTFGGTVIVKNVSEFNIYLTNSNIITGLLISCVVGLIAGLAPAISASRLNPVEAIASTF